VMTCSHLVAKVSQSQAMAYSYMRVSHFSGPHYVSLLEGTGTPKRSPTLSKKTIKWIRRGRGN
jgi:hypothetical protein